MHPRATKTIRIGVLAGMAAILLAACSGPSTTLATTWKDPGTIGPVHYQKVLAVLVDPNPAQRRTVEDELAARIPGAIPSYTIIPEDRLKDEDWVKAKVQESGFDGAVVLRFVGKEKSTTFVPGSGPVYVVGPGGFAHYWGTSWGYSPGYTVQDVTVVAETALYDINKGKVIWAARSETLNPSSSSEVVRGIVDASVEKMKKDGLIAAGGK